ncbi:hypothetical protein NG2371_06963 [Nocardia gamkensis]|nr:hypothetical protein [Nocardia gamkensis]
MPSVRHLCRRRSCATHGFGVGGRTVPYDGRHLGMIGQPGGQGVGFAVCQHIDPVVGCGVDHDRCIPVAAQQREIIDTHHRRNRSLRQGDTQQHTHSGMPGQPDRRSRQQPGTRPTGQLPHHRPHLAGQTRRATLVSLQNTDHLLAKGIAAARCQADQATDLHAHDHGAAIVRHVGHRPPVISVHSRGLRAAARTRGRAVGRPCPHHDLASLVDHILHHQRRQPRKHHSNRYIHLTHRNIVPSAPSRHHRKCDRAVVSSVTILWSTGSLCRCLPAFVAVVSFAAGRHPGTGRHGLRGAWHRPDWDMPADRSVPHPATKRADTHP